ncbi:unnamed protein product [Paramecium octaurelia]|uniref:Target of rapamycin complex subunit LST8 n=1 Tax=Paramecium octaurelia TaxID=43137 RepID=A0A8S1VY65_PAROT|nr:unnamed protein product [Paramecium octaurelia]
MSENDVILVTSSYDHTFIFWDATTGQLKEEINYGEKVIVNRIDISQDKKHLAAGGNFFASYYDVISQKKQPVYVYDGYKNNITGIGFLKDSNFFYTCSEDGYIRIHDLRSNNLSREYQEKEPLNTICLHPNETELIVGDQMGNVKIYDFQQNKVRLKLSPCPEVGIRSISIAYNASQIVAADSQGQCHTYMMNNMDLTEQSLLYKFEAHQDYILKASISADLRYLATCSADKTVKLWTLNEKNLGNDKYPKWELFSTLYGHGKWVWDCAFSCDSEYIITASSDLTTKIWQTDSAAVLRTLKGHKQAVTSLSINDIAID